VLLLGVLGPLTGCGGAARGGPDSLRAGTTTVHLTSGGHDRTAHVHLPRSAGRDAPLVLVLHGGYGAGAQAERSYGWDALADEQGFVVAYPDGLDRAWNSGGGCCGPSARDDVDDVTFLTSLVADLQRRTSLDPRRVFVAGMSNGAMMAYRLACQSDVVAAVGAVAGTISPHTDCPDPAPVSVLAVHGTADTRVLYDGGSSTVGSARVDARAAPEVSAFWRGVDGCAAPVVSTAPPLTTATATCPQGRSVELVSVARYGHEWPSPAGSQTPHGEPVYTGWDATAALWDFFAAHPRP
jgi:polyhydroxybutyrate depolymerase